MGEHERGGHRGGPEDAAGANRVPAAVDGASHGARRGRRPVIAIDGPAGAGKSTLARRVARKAGLVYLDTGAMYRAVACAVLQAGCGASPELDDEAVARVAETADIVLRSGAAGTRVWLDGRDVTSRIRLRDVDRLVPLVARLPAVRRAMVPKQRRLARAGGVVVDGRDVGTEVLPDADCKFFVTAAFEVRVERRYRQLRQRGIAVDRATVAEDLRQRDAMDAGRSVGALRPAPDAVHLDTTHMRIDDAVDLVLAHCGLRPGRRGPHPAGVHGEAGGP